MLEEEHITEERVLRALERIAFGAEEGAKVSEQMKALELLGKHLGLWKEAADGGAPESELSKLSELLEQRRQRRDGE